MTDVSREKQVKSHGRVAPQTRHAIEVILKAGESRRTMMLHDGEKSSWTDSISPPSSKPRAPASRPPVVPVSSASGPATTGATSDRTKSTCIYYLLARSRGAAVLTTLPKHQDRKSTRLNSSHVAISYA